MLCCNGRSGAVIVRKFDRFVRNVSHLLLALETFNALGVALVTLSGQIDTTTPTGRMIFNVLGTVRIAALPAEGLS